MNLLPSVSTVADYINEALSAGVEVQLDGDVVTEILLYTDNQGYDVLRLFAPASQTYDMIEGSIIEEVTLNKIVLGDDPNREFSDGFEETGYSSVITFHKVSRAQIDLSEVNDIVEDAE